MDMKRSRSHGENLKAKLRGAGVPPLVPRDRVASERTPLMASAVASITSKPPPESVVTSPRWEPDDLPYAGDRSREPSQLARIVGVALQKMDFLAPHLQTFYKVVLSNVLLACTILLLAKAWHREFFLKWSDNISPLANWNLQAANVTLVLTYALSNFLLLRFCLVVGCSMFVLYGLTSPLGYMVDMVLFNSAMALLNLRHALTLLYEKRHIEFMPEQEQVYRAVFADFMRRAEFQDLVSGALVRREKAGVVLKKRGDFVTSLMVIVKGQVEVKNRRGQVINMYLDNEFIEAPEWTKADFDPEGQRFRVTFVTSTEITYIKWPRETLVAMLDQSGDKLAAFRAILGIQTARLWLRSIELKDMETSTRDLESVVYRKGDSASDDDEDAGVSDGVPTPRRAALKAD